MRSPTALCPAYLSLGQLDRALKAAERALALQTELGDRAGQCHALLDFAVCCDALGDSCRAAAVYEQLLPHAAAQRDDELTAFARAELGQIYVKRGEPQRAVACLQEELVLRRRPIID